jgi:hypothetical protein
MSSKKLTNFIHICSGDRITNAKWLNSQIGGGGEIKISVSIMALKR